MTTSGALQKRIRRLEESVAATAGGGCKRCRGVLVVVSSAITGEFHSASWNAQPLSEDALRERETETTCPRCGARIDPDEAPVIRVGGLGS